uniref:Uncharacterized protein n=1 Tax=Pipistrellus kuhlii TaxID=59472 RepID=A0A7J7TQ82_PIPKU|nr:hypothetical protein mPipKuh1_009288 [Pipistrellus kuhlii]
MNGERAGTIGGAGHMFWIFSTENPIAHCDSFPAAVAAGGHPLSHARAGLFISQAIARNQRIAVSEFGWTGGEEEGTRRRRTDICLSKVPRETFQCLLQKLHLGLCVKPGTILRHWLHLIVQMYKSLKKQTKKKTQ